MKISTTSKNKHHRSVMYQIIASMKIERIDGKSRIIKKHTKIHRKTKISTERRGKQWKKEEINGKRDGKYLSYGFNDSGSPFPLHWNGNACLIWKITTLNNKYKINSKDSKTFIIWWDLLLLHSLRKKC